MTQSVPTTSGQQPSGLSSQEMLSRTRANILNRTLLALAAVTTAAVLLGGLVALARGNDPLQIISLGAVISISIFWVLTFLRNFLPYHARTAGLLIAIFIAALFSLFETGLVGPMRYNLLVIVIFGSIFWGMRRGLLLAVLAMATAILGGFAVQQGLITLNTTSVAAMLSGEAWLPEIFRFTAVTTIVISTSFQLIRESQRAFTRQQTLTKRLEEERRTLDQRINDRTRALRLTAEVSRTLVMILDKDQLVLEVVEQIQKAFNYYHVHIYLLDEEKQILHMAGGTGEAGKALLIGKHKIEVGQGLVGRAALMGIPILVANVSTDKYWLANPLLPETSSEIAVPIIHENKVIGVLDVQDDTPNSLGEADVDLLETIGNQLGVALTNADLYQKRTAQAVRQAKLNEISKRIQFAPNIESTVQVAVREIGHSLRANRTSILLRPASETERTPAAEIERDIQ